MKSGRGSCEGFTQFSAQLCEAKLVNLETLSQTLLIKFPECMTWIWPGAPGTAKLEVVVITATIWTMESSHGMSHHVPGAC